jgi:hypothetical protein
VALACGFLLIATAIGAFALGYLVGGVGLIALGAWCVKIGLRHIGFFPEL